MRVKRDGVICTNGRRHVVEDFSTPIPEIQSAKMLRMIQKGHLLHGANGLTFRYSSLYFANVFSQYQLTERLGVQPAPYYHHFQYDQLRFLSYKKSHDKVTVPTSVGILDVIPTFTHLMFAQWKDGWSLCAAVILLRVTSHDFKDSWQYIR